MLPHALASKNDAVLRATAEQRGSRERWEPIGGEGLSSDDFESDGIGTAVSNITPFKASRQLKPCESNTCPERESRLGACKACETDANTESGVQARFMTTDVYWTLRGGILICRARISRFSSEQNARTRSTNARVSSPYGLLDGVDH